MTKDEFIAFMLVLGYELDTKNDLRCGWHEGYINPNHDPDAFVLENRLLGVPRHMMPYKDVLKAATDYKIQCEVHSD